MHELFHQLGAKDQDESLDPGHWMAETLASNQRRLPNSEEIDKFFTDPEFFEHVMDA
ncbi:MAG: hypothetical protein KDA84_17770 [Planctomycetaceae bacterium]|nr:hypothetical protein [Planctomycetaceae bacterium]